MSLNLSDLQNMFKGSYIPEPPTRRPTLTDQLFGGEKITPVIENDVLEDLLEGDEVKELMDLAFFDNQPPSTEYHHDLDKMDVDVYPEDTND